MERRWQRMHPNDSGQATRAAHAVSLLWGFAEATVFFVVPDVWISRRALSSWRAALRGCGFALAGALVGCVLLFDRKRVDSGKSVSSMVVSWGRRDYLQQNTNRQKISTQPQ